MRTECGCGALPERDAFGRRFGPALDDTTPADIIGAMLGSFFGRPLALPQLPGPRVIDQGEVVEAAPLEPAEDVVKAAPLVPATERKAPEQMLMGEGYERLQEEDAAPEQKMIAEGYGQEAEEDGYEDGYGQEYEDGYGQEAEEDAAPEQKMFAEGYGQNEEDDILEDDISVREFVVRPDLVNRLNMLARIPSVLFGLPVQVIVSPEKEWTEVKSEPEPEVVEVEDPLKLLNAAVHYDQQSGPLFVRHSREQMLVERERQEEAARSHITCYLFVLAIVFLAMSLCCCVCSRRPRADADDELTVDVMDASTPLLVAVTEESVLDDQAAPLEPLNREAPVKSVDVVLVAA